MLDDDLAAWSNTDRSAGGTKGKNGIPTVLSPDQAQSVRMDVDTLTRHRTIAVKPGASNFRFDLENKTVVFTAHQKPYIPLGVFKSFVKMALAVMPDAERGACAHLARWVQEESHSLASLQALDVTCGPQAVVRYVAGPVVPNEIWYTLMRRKPDQNVDCPYMIFVLQFSNVVTQIIMPMSPQDRELKGRSLTLPIFPHPAQDPVHIARYGPATTHMVDWSSTEKTARGITKTMSMGFDDAKELQLDVANEMYRQHLESKGAKRPKAPNPPKPPKPPGGKATSRVDQDKDAAEKK
ncbi:hypothetical protein D9M72_276060 [compost metagenome]